MQKKYLPLALVLVALLTLLACLGFRIEATTAISLADESKEIYLTFDDGPSTSVTPRVLDILKEENVKATFFVVSDRVYDREDILRRAAAEGHTIGVHSATHNYKEIYASNEALLKDIAKCENVIARVTGIKPCVYRFPGGGYTPERGEIVKALGYRVIRWNAVCGDEELYRPDADALVRETVKTSRGKQPVVLLLHDSASHASTAEALPRIIAYFKEQGYTFRSF